MTGILSLVLGTNRVDTNPPETDMEKKIQLLYDIPTEDIGVQTLELPSDFYDRFPQIPDNVAEARREITHRFLTEKLLPRIQMGRKLTAKELTELASGFKVDFRQEHPDDFVGNYELIPAVEMRLLNLSNHYKSKDKTKCSKDTKDTAKLVETALQEVRKLVDENPDDLLTT